MEKNEVSNIISTKIFDHSEEQNNSNIISSKTYNLLSLTSFLFPNKYIYICTYI